MMVRFVQLLQSQCSSSALYSQEIGWNRISEMADYVSCVMFQYSHMLKLHRFALLWIHHNDCGSVKRIADTS